MNNSILLVDDEDLVRRSIKAFLAAEDYKVEEASSGEDALRLLNDKYFDLLLIDLRMPGLTGIEVLERLRIMHKKTEVILMTGYGTIDTAVEAIRAGAFDFLSKPIDFDRLLVTVRNAMEKTELRHRVDALATQVQKELNLDNIVGSNIMMLKIFDTIRRVSDSDVNVLITGESGTGKELLARALHVNSRRKQGPFVPVNCVALSENLLESELFGHEKGAFTGAAQRKRGYFEAAAGGTIFLDEIGDLSMPLQAKLLRTLQERTIQRVGSTELIEVDVRIVSATNKNLQDLVSQGAFREDLFYRLNVVPLRLPPLRERLEDIPDLVRHFLGIAEKEGLPPKSFEPGAIERLKRYHWPGNVRELENLVRRLSAIYAQDIVTMDMVESELASAARAPFPDATEPTGDLSEAVERFLADYFMSFGQELPPAGLYTRILRKIESPLITAALAATRGNQIRAADLLGLNRNTLRKKIRDLGIKVIRTPGT